MLHEQITFRKKDNKCHPLHSMLLGTSLPISNVFDALALAYTLFLLVPKNRATITDDVVVQNHLGQLALWIVVLRPKHAFQGKRHVVPDTKRIPGSVRRLGLRAGQGLEGRTDFRAVESLSIPAPEGRERSASDEHGKTRVGRLRGEFSLHGGREDSTNVRGLHGGCEDQVPPCKVRSPVHELRPSAGGTEYSILGDTLARWGMITDVVVAEGDMYWEEVGKDYGIEGFLPTHSNGSEDVFLLISKSGDGYIWSAIMSSLTAAGHRSLPVMRSCQPEPNGPAKSLEVTRMHCGVSLDDL
ncbi:uncharacterized protein EV422DRAFT_123571 [Fimicolochytrium jonesii]|uniref:uncharacterized protein n=1 Tax=Fimicolochytrium jonesii TaxID=1396493 RepID=UPI0022FDF91A|nr:uncharacterized protein EV422DRAFT_123571 [Fimicolochytrium jonesii]KAI8818872.1 hypothetical protein EV422DRAFT_123571 [Fimicolochytrium jonesii]